MGCCIKPGTHYFNDPAVQRTCQCFHIVILVSRKVLILAAMMTDHFTDLFCAVIQMLAGSLCENLMSTRVVPALVTLASDPEM